jgi:PRC-barrel domain
MLRLTSCRGISSDTMEHGAPVSYLAFEPGAEVVSSDGEVVGKVEHVLAAEAQDIFDGLIVDTQLGPGGLRFVDADQVEDLYERAAVLSIPASAVEQLPEPSPGPAVVDADPAEEPEGPLERKLRRAWDLISGNY